jgi:hypothetical protein
VSGKCRGEAQPGSAPALGALELRLILYGVLPFVSTTYKNGLLNPVESRGCYVYSFDYNRRRELLEGLQMAALNVRDPLLLRLVVALRNWPDGFPLRSFF